MSYEMARLSYGQHGISSSEQAVLTNLCIKSDKYGISSSSVASIIEDTKLDKKTIHACIKSLSDKGILIRTGEMVGRTKSIPVYQIVLKLTTKPL